MTQWGRVGRMGQIICPQGINQLPRASRRLRVPRETVSQVSCTASSDAAGARRAPGRVQQPDERGRELFSFWQSPAASTEWLTARIEVPVGNLVRQVQIGAGEGQP